MQRLALHRGISIRQLAHLWPLWNTAHPRLAALTDTRTFTERQRHSYYRAHYWDNPGMPALLQPIRDGPGAQRRVCDREVRAMTTQSNTVHTSNCAGCGKEHDLTYSPANAEDAKPYEEDGKTLALLGVSRCPNSGIDVYIMQVLV